MHCSRLRHLGRVGVGMGSHMGGSRDAHSTSGVVWVSSRIRHIAGSMVPLNPSPCEHLLAYSGDDVMSVRLQRRLAQRKLVEFVQEDLAHLFLQVVRREDCPTVWWLCFPTVTLVRLRGGCASRVSGETNTPPTSWLMLYRLVQACLHLGMWGRSRTGRSARTTNVVTFSWTVSR